MPASVNLSARDLIDQQLPDEIEARADGAGVPPELLELEITESVMMADPTGRARSLDPLGELGVGARPSTTSAPATRASRT